MEELLINENQNINLSSEEFVEQVRASVKVFSSALVKSKAYYNLLASSAVEAFLREKGLLLGESVAMHSSMKLLADFEIADIQLKNLSVDVRAVFDEDELFIPKKHFAHKILPDIYLFVKMDEDLQNATMLGFVKPASVNMQNQNEEYYFVNKAILSPVNELVDFIQSAPEKSQYVLSETAEETLEKLIMLYMDNDIEDVKLEKLVEYLKNSEIAREKLIEFENFERLSSMAIQEFKDLDVENNDFSKYMKTLVATDEFAQFGIEEGLSEEQVTASATGLFVDDEEAEVQNIEGDFELNLESDEEQSDEEQSDENEAQEFEAEETVEDELEVEEEVEEEIEEEIQNQVEPQIVDEFEMFDAVDEFDMPDSLSETEEVIEESSEIVEDVEEQVEQAIDETEVSDVYSQELQGEDLELQFGAMAGVEQDLLQEESEVVVEEDVTTNVIEEEIVSDVQLEELDVVVDEQIVETIDEPVVDVVEPIIENAIESDIEFTSEVTENVEVEDVVEETLDVKVEEDIVVDEEFSEIAENVVQDEEEQSVLADFDIPMVEDSVELDVEDVNVEKAVEVKEEEIDMSGVVTDDISFTEEVFDDIVDVVETPVEQESVVQDAVAETIVDQGIIPDVVEDVTVEEEVIVESPVSQEDVDDLTLDDLEMFAGEDATEDISVEDAEEVAVGVDSVTDEEIDNAIANANVGVDFAEDEEDKPFEDNIERASDDGGDFSLEELLEMENDLSTFEETSSEEVQVEAQENSVKAFVAPDDESEDVSEEFTQSQDSVENPQLAEMFDEDVSQGEGVQEEDSSDYAFAVDSKPAQKNILLPIAALVTVIGLAGAGAWYFLSHGKSTANNFEVADNSGVTDISLDMSDIVPAEDSLITDIPVSDNIKSESATPKAKTEAKTPAKADANLPKEPAKQEVKPLPEQLTMQKIKKDFSQPNTYLSVSKIVWDVPEYLTYNDDFAGYLQSLGSSVKLNLSSDLLLIAENTLFNKVKVKIQLKDSGRKFSAELTDSCGSKVVDDLVLQSVKNTLNQLQPPVNSLDTADEDLFVTIYL